MSALRRKKESSQGCTERDKVQRMSGCTDTRNGNHRVRLREKPGCGWASARACTVYADRGGEGAGEESRGPLGAAIDSAGQVCTIRHLKGLTGSPPPPSLPWHLLDFYSLGQSRGWIEGNMGSKEPSRKCEQCSHLHFLVLPGCG